MYSVSFRNDAFVIPLIEAIENHFPECQKSGIRWTYFFDVAGVKYILDQSGQIVFLTWESEEDYLVYRMKIYG